MTRCRGNQRSKLWAFTRRYIAVITFFAGALIIDPVKSVISDFAKDKLMNRGEVEVQLCHPVPGESIFPLEHNGNFFYLNDSGTLKSTEDGMALLVVKNQTSKDIKNLSIFFKPRFPLLTPAWCQTDIYSCEAEFNKNPNITYALYISPSKFTELTPATFEAQKEFSEDTIKVSELDSGKFFAAYYWLGIQPFDKYDDNFEYSVKWDGGATVANNGKASETCSLKAKDYSSTPIEIFGARYNKKICTSKTLEDFLLYGCYGDKRHYQVVDVGSDKDGNPVPKFSGPVFSKRVTKLFGRYGVSGTGFPPDEAPTNSQIENGVKKP